MDEREFFGVDRKTNCGPDCLRGGRGRLLSARPLRITARPQLINEIPTDRRLRSHRRAHHRPQLPRQGRDTGQRLRASHPRTQNKRMLTDHRVQHPGRLKFGPDRCDQRIIQHVPRWCRAPRPAQPAQIATEPRPRVPRLVRLPARIAAAFPYHRQPPPDLPSNLQLNAHISDCETCCAATVFRITQPSGRD